MRDKARTHLKERLERFCKDVKNMFVWYRAINYSEMGYKDRIISEVLENIVMPELIDGDLIIEKGTYGKFV